MRAVLPILALVLSASACAMPYSSGTYSPEAHNHRPLRARIVAHNNLAVQLNRPAYVAVFEILPGRGVGLVYPTVGRADGFMSSGYIPLWRPSNFYQASYLPDAFGYTAQGPRYLLLIASDQPLRVERFVSSPMALRSTLGFQRFASWNPHSLMDDLAEAVLPAMVDDNSWTSDVYVQWPEPPALRNPGTRLVAVRCGEGRVFYVPLAYLAQASQACPAGVTRPDTTTRSDTATIRKLPERPRIQPRRGDADESRERDIRARLQDRPQVERPGRPTRGEDVPRRVAPRPEVSRPERPERSEPRPEIRRPERPERPEPVEPRPAPRPEPEVRPAVERPERPTPTPERPPR